MAIRPAHTVFCLLAFQYKKSTNKLLSYTTDLFYGCGSELSEYENPTIWLVHKRSDVFSIARWEEVCEI